MNLKIIISLFFASLGANAAESFTETFNNTSLNTNLNVVASTNAFSFALSGGEGILSKQAGVGNGNVYVNSYFEMIGDFTATIQCGRTSLAPNTEAGLAISVGTNGFADIFFYGDQQIKANIFIQPGFGTQSAFSTAPTVSFIISRTNNTITLQYDAGSGVQTLHFATHTNLATAATLSFFLVNEFGDTGSHSVWFDNFSATASEIFAPWPFSVTIHGVSPDVINWTSITNRHYQVQYETALTNISWTALGQPAAGTGSTMSFTNANIGQPQGYYRVVESP